MHFVFGRDNLALTVFVPFDCKNNCPFCESKSQYKLWGTNKEDVAFQLHRVLEEYKYPIKDVVFTGGEPMANITELKKLIDIVPDKYNAYINTCLLKTGMDDFIKLVNDCNKIKGINVSRHCETYEKDCTMLHDIAPDYAVALFSKPVRINCVVQNQDIEAVISRWELYCENTNLCFRRNFNDSMTENELHDLYDSFLMKLAGLGLKYFNHTQCNVCDTTRFKRGDFIVSYHKGMKHSSIYYDDADTLEINDLIIFQDGRMAYDWEDSKLHVISKLEKQYISRVPYPSYETGFERLFNAASNYGCNCSKPHTTCGSGVGCGGITYSYSGCGGWDTGCGGHGCGG